MEYYSAIKRNEIGSSVEMWMNLETVLQSEVSQKEKNKYRILTHICGTQKNGTDEPVCRAEIKTQMQRTYGHQVGKVVGGWWWCMYWAIGIDIYTLICIKWITNENLLYQHRVLYLVLCGDLKGKEIQKRGDVCIRTADSLCYIAETNTTL